jgi:hypothetical protein
MGIVEGAEVRGDVLVDLEAERFASAERAASGEKRVEHPVLPR